MTDEISAQTAGQIRIGNMVVNRLGLGTNRITDTPAARNLLRRAVELDINFIDTAYRYQGGTSELTIGNTLSPYNNGLVIATKGGWEDDEPSDLRGFLETSLWRLKTDHIDLYQLHRPNPNIPIDDSVQMLKMFRDEGKIRHIGLSEVTIDQLKHAQKVAPITSVQNEYNILERRHEKLVDYCTENNIVFIPWFPLGGLSGGAEQVESKLADMADKYSASPQQIALAWLLKRSPMILPIPGTLSVEHLEENLRSAQIELSDEDYDWLTNP